MSYHKSIIFKLIKLILEYKQDYQNGSLNRQDQSFKKSKNQRFSSINNSNVHRNVNQNAKTYANITMKGNSSVAIQVEPNTTESENERIIAAKKQRELLERLYNEYISVRQKLSMLIDEFTQNSSLIMKEELEAAKSLGQKFDQHYANIQENSKDLVDSPEGCSPDEVHQFVASFDLVREKIKFISVMKNKGIEYFDERSKLESWLANNNDKVIYVMWFNCGSLLSNSVLWEKAKVIFIEHQQQQNEHKLTAIFNLKENSTGKKPVMIRVYKHGEMITENLMENSEKLSKQKALIQQDEIKSCPQDIVQARFPSLKIPCPLAIGWNAKCEDDPQEWHCWRCKQIVTYGFDNMIYCKCGRALVMTLKFQCNGLNHLTSFDSYPNEVLKILLKKLEPLEEYNILLLGESGAGKSTTINAIANYIKYKTFEEATNSEFLQLIPSNFSLPDPVHQGKTIEIKTGSNINERTEEGGSRTKDPMGYPFRFGDKLIRIIDTPGIGDTEGAETDKKNFEKILDYLHFHKVSNDCLQLF